MDLKNDLLLPAASHWRCIVDCQFSWDNWPGVKFTCDVLKQHLWGCRKSRQMGESPRPRYCRRGPPNRFACRAGLDVGQALIPLQKSSYCRCSLQVEGRLETDYVAVLEWPILASAKWPSRNPDTRAFCGRGEFHPKWLIWAIARTLLNLPSARERCRVNGHG